MLLSEHTPKGGFIHHLRIGDVIDGSRNSVHDMLLKQHYYYNAENGSTDGIGCCEDPWYTYPYNKPIEQEWNAYVKPLSHYSQLNFTNYDTVVLMGSPHKGQITDPKILETFGIKSCQYVSTLKHYIESQLRRTTRISRKKPKVILRVGSEFTPDEDIIYASQASTYVQSGGGFSYIIGELVKGFGGETINLPSTTNTTLQKP